jgi:hypothetical protein
MVFAAPIQPQKYSKHFTYKGTLPEGDKIEIFVTSPARTNYFEILIALRNGLTIDEVSVTTERSSKISIVAVCAVACFFVVAVTVSWLI